ncbi:MAG TPA: (2Fe-2S)-binding protein [Candidatus Sulfotelmatobacter sp.]|nr:(2Fe-2S)-binding protein [Candidatus Sulfotelmatobacter sp.]
MQRVSADARVRVSLTLNGRQVSGWAEARTLLCDFLRHELGETGTHVGCEHGVCGACTVRIDGVPARSCLALAVQADGRRIDTVEGLGGSDGALGPLQAAFRKHHALQCGFCTPGLLMSLSALFNGPTVPTEDEIRDTVGGHLCRCTGYAGIMAAAREVAEDLRKSGEKS